VFITTQVTAITRKVALLGIFSPLIFSMLKMLPYGLVWALFTIVYMLMPNTRVRFGPGFLAGVIAGTAYQVAQWGYISFQIGVARYNAIYGSFAALPLFLIWLQVSWLIVLFGAEISYAAQNSDLYEFEPDSRSISLYFKQLLSLLVARLFVEKFSRGEPLLTAHDISRSLSLPVRIVRQVLAELVESGAFSKTAADNADPPTYQPAVDTSLLTVQYVLEALNRNGANNIPVSRTREFEALSGILQSFRETLERSSANKLLKDI